MNWGMMDARLWDISGMLPGFFWTELLCFWFEYLGRGWHLVLSQGAHQLYLNTLIVFHPFSLIPPLPFTHHISLNPIYLFSFVMFNKLIMNNSKNYKFKFWDLSKHNIYPTNLILTTKLCEIDPTLHVKNVEAQRAQENV